MRAAQGAQIDQEAEEAGGAHLDRAARAVREEREVRIVRAAEEAVAVQKAPWAVLDLAEEEAAEAERKEHLGLLCPEAEVVVVVEERLGMNMLHRPRIRPRLGRA